MTYNKFMQLPSFLQLLILKIILKIIFYTKAKILSISNSVFFYISFSLINNFYYKLFKIKWPTNLYFWLENEIQMLKVVIKTGIVKCLDVNSHTFRNIETLINKNINVRSELDCSCKFFQFLDEFSIRKFSFLLQHISGFLFFYMQYMRVLKTNSPQI